MRRVLAPVSPRANEVEGDGSDEQAKGEAKPAKKAATKKKAPGGGLFRRRFSQSLYRNLLWP